MKFYLNGGGFRTIGETVELAQQAEELGFAGITFGDHLFYAANPSTPYPYTDDGSPRFALDAPWPDVWVLIGALSTVTSKLHFMTTVYILPLRHPLIVARALGTAAVLAEGRVELGVGVGHLRDEFDALEVDFTTRGRRTDEAIGALRALLNPGAVSHHGEFWNIDSIYMHPAPREQVPIFIGGESKPALARTARIGDGYISIPHTIEELECLITELTRLRKTLAPERAPLRFHLHGTDLKTLGDFRRLADSGADAVNVAFWRRAREPLPHEQRLEAMHSFADSVITKL